MRCRMPGVNRRDFLAGSLAAGASLMTRKTVADTASSARPEICAFIKFVQSYSYAELAERIAESGFDGVEATIRRKGYIEPAQAADELPALVEQLTKHGLKMTVMTSDILAVDSPHAESQLRAAAALGVPRYRMGFYRYDMKRPILQQIEELRPRFKELAALNAELGIQAVYQNHSGPNYVGSPIWDLLYLFRDLQTKHMSAAFDIRHATIEGGYAWRLHYDVIRPHVGALFVKDFDWIGEKAEHVPLGEGRVDPEFFSMVRQGGYQGPYSLHVEYLKKGTADENLAAMQRDLKQLKTWLSS